MSDKKMTVKQLASAIAKAEGKKSEVSIGNIREILKIIADLNPQGSVNCLIGYAHYRKAKNAWK